MPVTDVMDRGAKLSLPVGVRSEPAVAELFLCPKCGVTERPANGAALERLLGVGLCQGCRAARTLKLNPWLLPLFVSFWNQTGLPESSSWMDAVEVPSLVHS